MNIEQRQQQQQQQQQQHKQQQKEQEKVLENLSLCAPLSFPCRAKSAKTFCDARQLFPSKET